MLELQNGERAVMNSNTTLRLASYSAIALAAGVLILMPKAMQSAVATSGTETLDITGVVRDFRSSDAGFVPPIGTSWQHVAGNVALSLDGNYRPVFDGGGFAVGTQWRNGGGEPIAPHLYEGPATNIISAVNAPTINNNPIVDTWNSNFGAYGGGNVGGKPVWKTGSTMPAVSAPSPLPAYTDKVEYSAGNGISTISTNIYCKTFTISNQHTVQISGTIFIYCTDTFKIENVSHLKVLPGSSLVVYFAKNCTIQNDCTVNINSWTPGQLTFVNLGTTTMVMENGSKLCGKIISPNATLHVKNGNQFYGNFVGKNVILDNEAGFHTDVPDPVDACGALFKDTVGSGSGASAGAIASAADYGDWFADVLPRNLYTSSTITLVKNASGVYEYYNDAFFPIDNLLFGNESAAHNYYFTFTFTVEFVHRACEGRFFEFEGADDAWMFVDGDLAMDLGGIRAGTHQYVEFDRLDLVDGETYRLHFFYAQRNPTEASFGMRTNLDLIRPNDPFAIGSGAD
jgi:fibro-slime domain-containing protein